MIFCLMSASDASFAGISAVDCRDQAASQELLVATQEGCLLLLQQAGGKGGVADMQVRLRICSACCQGLRLFF